MTVRMLTHATSTEALASILHEGIEPRRTADHNYPSYPEQPTGVYAMPVDAVPWHRGAWLVTFAWCGPAIPDPELNLYDPSPAVCLPDHVPASAIAEVSPRYLG